MTPTAISTPHTVRVQAGTGGAGQQLASLPMALRPSVVDAAELVAVSGAAGWTARAAAALADGARGVLVVDPGPEDAQGLAETAAARRTPVVLDRPFASNPAVAQALPLITHGAGRNELIELTVTVPVNADRQRTAGGQWPARVPRCWRPQPGRDAPDNRHAPPTPWMPRLGPGSDKSSRRVKCGRARGVPGRCCGRC